MRPAIAAALLAACLSAEDAMPLPDGASLDIVVQEVQGEVDVRTSPREKTVAATKGMKIPVEAKIWVGAESAIQLAFGTNSTATLAPFSICEVRAFEMKGDQLVARIHIEPGVADVKLKQLAAFHTDFQVSTPRMTCSVRGSGANVGSECDEIEDHATCTEHEAHASDSTGKEHTLTEGSKTNQDGDSNADIATQENVAGTTPTGTTKQETENPDLLAQNQGSIDSTTSDATVNTDPSPTGGATSGTQESPPPEPTENLTQDEKALLRMTLADLDALEHIARDDVTSPRSEINSDSAVSDMDVYAQANGFMAFVEDKLEPYLKGRFDEDPDGLSASDPDLFASRRDMLLAALEDLHGALLLADTEAHSPVSNDALGRALEDMLHAEYHIIEYARQPGDADGQFDFEHDSFHTENLGKLQTLRGDGEFDLFLATYIEGGVDAWEDRTGCDDDDEDPPECDPPGDHFENRLVEIARNFREAGGDGGVAYRSAREHDANHVFYDLDDLRHHVEPDDPTEFEDEHADHEISHTAVDIIGVAAVAKVFRLGDHHERIDEQIDRTFSTDPRTRDQRHDDVHDAANFGVDVYGSDWQQVQDDARAGSLSPTTMAKAILNESHLNWHSRYSTLLPGQYESEHADAHSRIDALFDEAGSDFEQFKTDFMEYADDAWHQETRVPEGVSVGQPGYEAHRHFHEMLQEFHDDADSAVGE